MKRIILMILCVAAFVGANAQSGNAAYEAELNKAVALSCDKQMLTELFDGTFRMYVDRGMLSASDCRLMSAEMTEMMYPILVSIVKELWADEFTLDELKQIVAWLSSPVGKKCLMMSTKTGSATQELIQNPEVMQEVTAIIGKYMK